MTTLTDGGQQSLRHKVYKYLEVEADDRGFERLLNVSLAALIVLNIGSVILETVEDLYAQYTVVFHVFEVVSVAIFTGEYLLRVWSCTANPAYRHPVFGRVRYVLSPMALIDLAAIAPSFIPGTTLDLRFARSARLLRLLRSLKFIRYSHSLQTLGRVLHSRRDDLLVTAFSGLILLVCAASGIYFAEHEAQPKAFASIPAALWWGVVTLTTVGYGDVYPVTVAGKMVAGTVAMLGVGLFALPAGIVASGFAEEVQRRKAEAANVCPHCGKEI